ncbi:hypothetical protein M3A49_07505 [Paraburkholderia sp. CNPSo 3076]|uniref:hypothetical protein n=1 Tax=Paraburkholderia sp. CNPSo 3076 TaxID=2940936 RepID=UPI0022575543|nr:hypothetical protein [Paraburkholderia sp. CNPSo 3076]MCX5539342.1 hypothetical protein [Paraburkholderia sp. CNPSo 3076]
MNIPVRRVGLRIVAPMLVALCGAVSAQAADIHVLATGALSAAFKTIAPAFEKSTGNRLIDFRSRRSRRRQARRRKGSDPLPANSRGEERLQRGRS